MLKDVRGCDEGGCTLAAEFGTRSYAAVAPEWNASAVGGMTGRRLGLCPRVGGLQRCFLVDNTRNEEIHSPHTGGQAICLRQVALHPLVLHEIAIDSNTRLSSSLLSNPPLLNR